MPDFYKGHYACTGASMKRDALGMREMQARAYAKRNTQYLLLKAPPASGKSRALMFLALHKVLKQGLKKAVIAVPEMSIGASFGDTDLKSGGFFADWRVELKWNLCLPGADAGKVNRLLAFLEDPEARWLVCTHATLRFAWAKLVEGNPDRIHAFDGTVLAVDEFHHVSAEEGNVLGEVLDDVVENSSAHVVAMTGSYFRGDAKPILNPETEARFTPVVYTYYEQLNGCEWLKSLGLGYHFYQGDYFDALREILDPEKKTIVHIPNVNSQASTGRKYEEVDKIIGILGRLVGTDRETNVMTVRTASGRLLKVADLVSDDPVERGKLLAYLRTHRGKDDMGVIIALNMAKEGFDWPACEHVLTIGYRKSLTEVIQIIGRATRDFPGKSHAQFTNLIAEPDASRDSVQDSVNDLLKAIALSLLMREVLAPNVNFRPRSSMRDGEEPGENDIIVDETTDRPLSPVVKEIMGDGGIKRIVEEFLNDSDAAASIAAGDVSAAVEVAMPRIVAKLYPNSDLAPDDIDVLSRLARVQIALRAGDGKGGDEGRDGDGGGKDPGDAESGGRKGGDGEGGDGRQAVLDLLHIKDRLIRVDELDMDLIDRIAPFRGAYEIFSKHMDAPTLKTIQDRVEAMESSMSEQDAILLWPHVKEFAVRNGREPSPASSEPYERRLAKALAIVRSAKARRLRGKEESS